MILKCDVSKPLSENLIFFDSLGNIKYSAEFLRHTRKYCTIYLKNQNGEFLYWMMRKGHLFKTEYIIDDFISVKSLYAYCKSRKIYTFLENKSHPLVLSFGPFKKNFEICHGNIPLLQAFSKGFFLSEYTLEFKNERYIDLCVCLSVILFDLLNNRKNSTLFLNMLNNMGA